MALHKKEGVRQTHWVPPQKLGFAADSSPDFWYADLSADVVDLAAIERAKAIVDHVMPQRLSTQYGGHYYSFIQREFLLNMLLHFWHDHGHFPSGWICMADELPMTSVGHFGWWAFKHRKRAREYPKPLWLRIPDLPMQGVTP